MGSDDQFLFLMPSLNLLKSQSLVMAVVGGGGGAGGNDQFPIYDAKFKSVKIPKSH